MVLPVLLFAAPQAFGATETVAEQFNPAHTGVTDERIGPPLKVRWKRQFRHPERGYEFPIGGALAAGGRVFAMAVNESSVTNPPPPSHLYALDPKNGETLWTRDVQHFVDGMGYGSGKVLVGGSSGTGKSSGVEALDAATGAAAWTRMDWPGQSSNGTGVERILVAGDQAFVIFHGSTYVLYAVSVPTGDVLWQQPLRDGSGLAADADRVYVAQTHSLSAFSRSDGAVAWETETPADSSFTGDPVVAGGRLLMAGSTPHGGAYDAATGALLRYPVSISRYPAADADRVYTNSSELRPGEDSITEAIPLAPGATGWEFGAFTGTLTHPVVVGDVVYVAGHPRGLFALDKADGSIEWCSRPLFAGAQAPLAVEEGLLLVPTQYTLLAFEPGGRPGCRFYRAALPSYTDPIEGYPTTRPGRRASAAHAQGFMARRTANGRLLGFAAEGSDSRVSVGAAGVRVERGDDALFGPRVRVSLRVLGARRARAIRGERRLPGLVNVYSGRDPRHWRTAGRRFGRVRLEGIRPHVDMVVREPSEKGFEYDFELAPGADPSSLAVRFVGAGRPVLDSGGNLHLSALGDAIVQAKPVAYQRIDGRRVLVPARFRLRDGVVGFALGRYDHTKELVIDPTLQWSTYFGGGAEERATGIASDPAGNIHVVGWTNSRDLPGLSAFDGWDERNAVCPISNPCLDVFVAKYSPAGKLLHMTYISGEDIDAAGAVAADAAGNSYVTGNTMSQQRFPIKSAFQTDWRCGTGPGDAFVAKIGSNGSLVYSSYLGGCGGPGETGEGIAVDGSGRAVVAGYTGSTEFPTTEGAADRECEIDINYCYEGFVSRVSADGTRLEWSTLNDGAVADVELDSQGRPVIVGEVGSVDQRGEAFAARLTADGSAYEWAATWGGTYYDRAGGLALDGADDLHIVGTTDSRDFPTTQRALDRSCGRPLDPLECYDAEGFATEIAADGSRLIASTYIEGLASTDGEGNDFDVAVDGKGRAYVVGMTGSRPIERGSPYRTCASLECRSEAFILRLNPAKTALDYRTLHGGLDSDDATGVTLAGGDAWITGWTSSPNVATTPGAPQRRWSGGNCSDFAGGFCPDAFVARIDQRPPRRVRVRRGVRDLRRTKTSIAGRVVSPKRECREEASVIVQLRREGQWLTIGETRSGWRGRFFQGFGEIRGRMRLRLPRVLRPGPRRVRVCLPVVTKRAR